MQNRPRTERIERYLRKRRLAGPWSLEPPPDRAFSRAIVIPALAESDWLPKTFHSIAQNDATMLADTLVVVVVNNRDESHVSPAAIRDNQQTLASLRADRNPNNLHMAVADASSPGRELPARGGVGLARKIGFDLALEKLRDDGVLISLDADTLVQPNYLESVDNHFRRSGNPWGAVIDYAHPIEGPHADQILLYETFLRYHALGLRYAGSPYAYHTIGSAMAATAEAYAVAGGMNSRQAGEDFYFLERLAKTGSVARITTTHVCPSPRKSWRVPFGTGRAVGAPERLQTVYAPELYDILRLWLRTLTAGRRVTLPELQGQVREIEPLLDEFLDSDGFYAAWDRIRAESKSQAQYTRRVHERFGAWTTLKLMHLLRDTRYPDGPIWENVAVLLNSMGEGNRLSAQELRGGVPTLNLLRRLDAH